MQHLRVVSPSALTDQVVELIDSEAGALQLTVSRDVVQDPAGDVVEAAVTRLAADTLLDALKNLGVEEEGAVSLTPIGSIFSTPVQRMAASDEDADDAMIWEQLIAQTGEESRLTWTFASLQILAVLIAAVGVVTDSPVTVVGAMVVGPEFGALAAVAVNLVRRRADQVGRSLSAIAIGFPAAMILTWLGALVAKALGAIGPDTLENTSQVSFIYQVGPFSLIVALLAGTAGMISMISAKSTALVGVFISTTTVPAAGYAVVAATLGRWTVAAQSVAQLLVNLIGITAAAWLVLAVTHHRRTRAGTSHVAGARRRDRG